MLSLRDNNGAEMVVLLKRFSIKRVASNLKIETIATGVVIHNCQENSI